MSKDERKGISEVGDPYQLRAFESGFEPAASARTDHALLPLTEPKADLISFQCRQREVRRCPAVGDSGKLVVDGVRIRENR